MWNRIRMVNDMDKNGTGAWIESALWIRGASMWELFWRSACIPLIPFVVIILVEEFVKLIGG